MTKHNEKLREILPKKKEIPQEGLNAERWVKERNIGYNQALSDCFKAIKNFDFIHKSEVELDEGKILYMLYDRNSLGIKLYEQMPEDIAHAIAQGDGVIKFKGK